MSNRSNTGGFFPSLLIAATLVIAGPARAAEPTLMKLGDAWAANSVNTTVFRNDPVTTHGNHQFAAYYDANSHVVIASRTIGETQWKAQPTNLSGNTKDAHNVISMIAD